MGKNRIEWLAAAILSMLFLVLLHTSLPGCAVQAAQASQKKSGTVALSSSGEARTGAEAPWFSGWTPDNEVVNLTKLFAEPDTNRVALVFFATWCDPCIKGMQMLKKAERRLKKAGVKVVLVDFKEETDLVARFIKKQCLPFTVVLDPFGKMQGTYLDEKKVELPRTVLIDKRLKVIGIFGIEGKDYIDRLTK